MIAAAEIAGVGLGELSQYAAAFVAVALASGWLTVRVLRRKTGCGGACDGCERALEGRCSTSEDRTKADPPAGGVRAAGLQVLPRGPSEPG